MTSRDPDGGTEHLLLLQAASDRISTSLELIDLRLKHIDSELLLPSPSTPLDLNASVSVVASRLGEFVIYDVSYDLTTTDRNERTVLKALITFNLLLRIKSGDLGPDDITAFGSVGAIDIAHPFAREFVSSITGRMGLPPLVLDIRPPKATGVDDN